MNYVRDAGEIRDLRNYTIDPRRLDQFMNSSQREKRGRIADFIAHSVRNSLEGAVKVDQLEVGLIVGKWHDLEQVPYWSGILHKFVMDLFMGNIKENSGWRGTDRRSFDSAWLMIEGDFRLKYEYQLSYLLYDHLGIDPEFLSTILFGGLETCGIITSRINIQSQVLIQWEVESGGN